MTTVGEILDKLTILYKRRQVFKEQKKLANINDLNIQESYLLISLAEIIIKITEKDHPGILKKHKIYDSEVKNESLDNLLDLIQLLQSSNEQLLMLEDIRRDKSKSDEERLKAADDVSIYNKIRNNTIDNIDQYIVDKLKLIEK